MRSTGTTRFWLSAVSGLAFLIVPFISLTAVRADDEQQAERDATRRAGIPIFTPGLKDGIQALSYNFCVGLRNRYTKEPLKDEAADHFREFLDPEYLKKHNLEEGDLPIVTTPFRRLDEFRVSDDLRTIFCVVENDAGRKEVILMRLVIERRDEKYSCVYIRPGNPPNPETGFFAPWVLKAEISEKPASLALPVPE